MLEKGTVLRRALIRDEKIEYGENKVKKERKDRCREMRFCMDKVGNN